MGLVVTNFNTVSVQDRDNSPLHNYQYTPSLNDIRIEYHPSAKLIMETYTFEEYCNNSDLEPTEEYLRSLAAEIGHNSVEISTDKTDPKRPWRPFATCLDFELAEIILDSHMNSAQIDQVISIIQRSIPDSVESKTFTLKNRAHLDTLWEHARKTRGTGVCALLLVNIMTVEF